MWSELQGTVLSQLPNPEDSTCWLVSTRIQGMGTSLQWMDLFSTSQELLSEINAAPVCVWQTRMAEGQAQSTHGCRGRQDMADDGSGLGTGEDTTSLSCQPALASAAPASGRGALQGHNLIICCSTCNLLNIWDTLTFHSSIVKLIHIHSLGHKLCLNSTKWQTQRYSGLADAQTEIPGGLWGDNSH